MAGVIVPHEPAPGWAAELFVDGAHATTRLAEAALREALATRRGARVLDVGTGTGFLAGCALQAGAGEVVGIDHEPKLVSTARALVPAARFHVVDAQEYLTQVGGGAFDVVVANVPDPPLSGLVPALAAAARVEGLLLVTGLLLWQSEHVLEELSAAGARPREPRAHAGWCLIEANC